jgi:hypothetical protein
MSPTIAFNVSSSVRGALAAPLARSLGCDQDTAAIVVDDMQRFLYLCGTSAVPLTPSRAIDAAWHLLIGDHERYEAFCRSACGRTIPHLKLTDKAVLAANRQRAEALSFEIFGRPLDSKPDEVDADCGSCCSSDGC